MTRLIDADAFIEHLKKTAEVNNDHFSELEKGLTFLVDAYATFKEVDAVEVIRCNDCKWNDGGEWVDCYMSGMHGRTSNKNYCSRAERKEK